MYDIGLIIHAVPAPNISSSYDEKGIIDITLIGSRVKKKISKNKQRE